MRWKSALDSPLAAAAATALCYAFFILALWNARGRDVTRFIVAGRDTVDVSQLPEGITAIPGGGYDGTAFYRLALDPLVRDRTAYGITLDSPAYRQQRIGYPLAARLLAGGNPRWIPWALVAVNFLAMTAMGGVGALFARSHGRHAMWGVLFPLYPGFLYSVSRDLSEALACTLALAAIAAIPRRRWLLAAVALSAAVLTRETVLLVVAGGCAAIVYDRLRSRPAAVPAWVFAVPALVYATWQALLTMKWDVVPLAAGPRGFTMPFVEYARTVAASSSLRGGHRLVFSEAAFLGISMVIAAMMLRRSASGTALKVSWCGYLLLASTLPREIWDNDVGFMRILGDLYVIGAAVIIASARWARWTLFLTGAIVWYYLASHLVKYW